MESEYLSIDTVKRIAELERELIEANESITWWSNRFKSLQEINKIQAKKIIDLTLKKDRAIEYIEDEIESAEGSIYVEIPEENYIKIFEDLLNILNGENNE